MNLVTWRRNPWSVFDELDSLQDDMGRAFGNRGYWGTGAWRATRPAMNVWSSEDRHGTTRAKQVAQRVGELCGLGEGANEDDVHVLRQLVDQVFEARVANEADVVPVLFTPDTQYLRHDARQIGVHDAGVKRLRGSLRDQVNDPYALWTQRSSSCVAPERF